MSPITPDIYDSLFLPDRITVLNIMYFQYRVSLHTLNLLPDSELPGTAIIGLEQHFDCESLRILAGLSRTDSPFLLNDYYQRALKELGFDEQTTLAAVLIAVGFLADRIITKNLDPYEGYDEIDTLLAKTPHDPQELGLELCYADYISIWEVQGDGLQLHEGSGLSKEEYIAKLKHQLRLHLERWLEKSCGKTQDWQKRND